MHPLPLILLLLTLAAGADNHDLHQLVAERQFAPALQRISASLALKGPAAKSVDRFDLYMLKAECHLQLRVSSLAAEAYANAIQAAPGDADRAVATAHAALLKAARGFAYAPKATTDKGRQDPIDILDRDNRKRAFLALFADELAADADKLKAANVAKTLPPIIDTFKPLMILEGYERAATGECARVAALRADLMAQTKKVLADAQRTMNKRVGEIDKEANTFVETWQDTYVGLPGGLLTTRKERVYKKKGLTDPQTQYLQETTATCDRIALTLSDLTKGLAAEDAALDPVADEATRLRKDVDKILDTDYQRVYHELPKK